MRTERDDDPPNVSAAEKEGAQEAFDYIAAHPLAACPFCGAAAKLAGVGHALEGYWTDNFVIQCTGKNCWVYHNSREIAEAVQRWNRRVESQREQALTAIYDMTEGFADGAPDASAHDRLCNEVSALARPWISNQKPRAEVIGTPMTQTEQTQAFVGEVERVIHHFRKEFSLDLAGTIGGLEIIKLCLFKEHAE